MDKKFNHYPELVTLQDYNIKVKPYLTMEEVFTIGEGALEKNNYIEKEQWINQCLLTYCVPDENFDGFEYDMLNANGVFTAVRKCIINFNEIDAYIQDRLSVTKEVINFIGVLTDAVKKVEKKVPNKKEWNKITEWIKDKTENV